MYKKRYELPYIKSYPRLFEKELLTNNFKLMHDTDSEINGNWGLLQGPDRRAPQNCCSNCRQGDFALSECTGTINIKDIVKTSITLIL